jgi:hypothetical protein
LTKAAKIRFASFHRALKIHFVSFERVGMDLLGPEILTDFRAVR